MMNYIELEYFKKTVECGCVVNRAASELFISQPALSFALKSFEKKLGYELFVRSGRKIYLSEEGKAAYTVVRELLSETDASFKKIYNTDGNKDEVIKLYSDNPLFYSYFCRDKVSLTNVTTVTKARFEAESLSNADFDILLGSFYPSESESLTNYCKYANIKLVLLLCERLCLFVPKTHPFASYEYINADQLVGLKYNCMDNDKNLKAWLESCPSIKKYASADNIDERLFFYTRLKANSIFFLNSRIADYPVNYPLRNEGKIIPVEAENSRRGLFLLYKDNEKTAPAAERIARLFYRTFCSIHKKRDSSEGYELCSSSLR